MVLLVDSLGVRFPLGELSTILEASTTGVPLDFLGDEEGTTTTIDVYMVVNDVEGLPRGSYFFNRSTSSVDLLKNKVSRNTSGYLCLGQALFSDASVVFFLMADLITLLRTCGNRGYRASQFEAGVIAGKIYLASYAQQLGASGSTFFDYAVTEFFSPHAKDKNNNDCSWHRNSRIQISSRKSSSSKIV